MHGIGLLLLIAGFTGVPAIVILNASQNLLLTVIVHASVTALVIGLCIRKCGSAKAWFTYSSTGESHSVHPGWIALVGLIFTATGIYIILHGKPSAGPKAMSLREISYFGSLFVLTGAGIAARVFHRVRASGKS